MKLKSRSSAVWACLFLLVLAFALRAYNLGTQSIWWDEGRNIFTASRALAQIASAPELDIHPPLYFYLFHFWIGVAGVSEFATRFFSLWFGVVGVALAYRIGAYIADRRVGLWTAFLIALAPFLVDEAQQVRMYTLLIVLSALSMYFLARTLTPAPSPTGRGVRNWILYAVTALASFYTHYSFIYLLAAQNLYLLIIAIDARRAPARLRAVLTGWIGSQLAIAALYAFQIPNILRQSHIYGNPGMTPPSLDYYVLELTRAFLIGVKVAPDRAAWIGLGIVVVMVAALLSLLPLSPSPFPYSENGKGKRSQVLLLLWFLVPLAAYYVVMQFSPQFTQRYALIAILPLFALLAIAFASLSRSFALGALAALIWLGASAGALSAQYSDPAFFNDDTRGLAQFIAEKATKDDVVLIDVPFPFDYYYRGAAPAHYFFVDIHTAAAELTRLTQNKQRVFWITWGKSDTDPRGVVLFLLDKYAAYEGDAAFRGYSVAWYRLPRATTFALASAPRAASALFGDRIVLTGFEYGGAVTSSMPDADAPRVKVGSKAWVALWWSIVQPVREDYKVSIQLRDANGNLAAQDDRMLIDDRHFRTRLWTTSETAINVYTPELLEGVKPGKYTVYVIVYEPVTNKRLETDAGTEFTLGKIQIVQ